MNFAIVHLVLINVVLGLTPEDLENKANDYIVELKGQIIISNTTIGQLVNTKTTMFRVEVERRMSKISEVDKHILKSLEKDATVEFIKCRNCPSRSLGTNLEFIERRPQGLRKQCRNLLVDCGKDLEKLQDELGEAFKNALRIIAGCKKKTRMCLEKLQKEYSERLEEIAVRSQDDGTEVEIVTSGLTIQMF